MTLNVTNLVGFGGGAKGLTRTFEDSDGSASDLSEYTFSSLSISTTPGPRRRIVVGVCTSIASNTASVLPSGVTIGGLTATLRESQIQQGGTSSSVSFWSVTLPTGSTADVVVTASVTLRRCAVAMWALEANSEAPSNSGGTSSGGTISLTVTVPAGGLGMSCAIANDSGPLSLTFSGTANPVEVADFFIDGGSNLWASNFDISGTVVHEEAQFTSSAIWAAWAP